MIKYCWGTIASGKSLKLLSEYLNQKRKNPDKVALVKPSTDTRTTGVFTRFANVEMQPDLILKPEDGLPIMWEALKDKEFIFVDEAQWLSVDQVLCMRHMNVDKVRNFYVYGLRSDYKGAMWPATSTLMQYADTIEQIEIPCEICSAQKASFNIRNAECDTDVGFHYTGACFECFSKNRLEQQF